MDTSTRSKQFATACEPQYQPLWAGQQMYQLQRGSIMNKDQVEGKLKEVGGKIQEAAGKVVGSEEQQAKGLANQVEGKVQKKVGDVKDAVETVTRKP
jgi:uncharacterized protein YjbJ (UPF0337 family)